MQSGLAKSLAIVVWFSSIQQYKEFFCVFDSMIKITCSEQRTSVAGSTQLKSFSAVASMEREMEAAEV